MKPTLLLTAALLTHPVAMAQTYVGITGGPTRANIDCEGATSCDKTGFGLKVYGGYKFTPNLALEGSYADLGRAKVSGYSPALGKDFFTAQRSTALSIGGAFFYEFVPNFTAIGRLGLASGKLKITTEQWGDSDTKINPYVGVGVGYSLTPALSVNGTLDINRFKYRGDAQNVFMLGAGVSYGF
jgi:OmpA-OmpF porin, OOP family